MKAFPTEHPLIGTMNTFSDGMDLRDYFAAKAMQSLILGLDNGNESQADLIPSTAYGFADAMMKAREQ
jgi:hypothetical protein